MVSKIRFLDDSGCNCLCVDKTSGWVTLDPKGWTKPEHQEWCFDPSSGRIALYSSFFRNCGTEREYLFVNDAGKVSVWKDESRKYEHRRKWVLDGAKIRLEDGRQLMQSNDQLEVLVVGDKGIDWTIVEAPQTAFKFECNAGALYVDNSGWVKVAPANQTNPRAQEWCLYAVSGRIARYGSQNEYLFVNDAGKVSVWADESEAYEHRRKWVLDGTKIRLEDGRQLGVNSQGQVEVGEAGDDWRKLEVPQVKPGQVKPGTYVVATTYPVIDRDYNAFDRTIKYELTVKANLAFTLAVCVQQEGRRWPTMSFDGAFTKSGASIEGVLPIRGADDWSKQRAGIKLQAIAGGIFLTDEYVDDDARQSDKFLRSEAMSYVKDSKGRPVAPDRPSDYGRDSDSEDDSYEAVSRRAKRSSEELGLRGLGQGGDDCVIA